ncbi:hypothetical protein JXJ21_13530 [candidate division KSB1 bacterium]|nr:hypothetical protein [candidate division KSB1 bacterium]
MRNPITWFAVLCLVAGTRAIADELPEQAAGWRLTDRGTFMGQKLFDHINGGAEIYFEYGFARLDVAYYQKDEKEIVVERYRMADSPAAYGIYSFSRDPSSPSLPEPYTGGLNEYYVECVNGNDYIKMINYDSIPSDERMRFLKAIVPKPARKPNTQQWFKTLPEKRIGNNEVSFNGLLSLKNFCVLGQSKDFSVGKTIHAVGCLLPFGEKQLRCVVLSGKSGELASGLDSFLENIVRMDFAVKQRSQTILLEDTLSGDYVFIFPQQDRLNFVFGIEPSMAESLLSFFK